VESLCQNLWGFGKMEADIDDLILKEIEQHYKTVRRICEDLQTIGVEITNGRVDKRLQSLRKYNLVKFKILDFPILGPKPMAYKKK